MLYLLTRSQIFLLLFSLLMFCSPLIASTSISSDDAVSLPPNTPSFYIREGWVKLKCIPKEMIIKKGSSDRVKYHCMQNHLYNAQESSSDQSKEARGREETERMREKVRDKVDVGAIYNIRRNQFIAKQQIMQSSNNKIVHLLLPAKLYVSFRPQISGDGEEHLKLRDGGSRGGFFYYHQFTYDIGLMLQYEASINFANDKSFINLSDASNSSRRLSYLSLEYHDSSIILGKYWSPYYAIAGFTDYFMAYGSSASGAFNNHSDGSASGTGRSDTTLQLRTKREKYDVAIQVQPDHNASDSLSMHYDYTLSSSLIYKDWMGMKLGLAFVYGNFDRVTDDMYMQGIDGNEQSYIAGVSYSVEKIDLSAIVTYSKNHISDDQGYYFDALGAELYMHYDYSESIRIAYGVNWLAPVDDNYKGDFNIKKHIISLQYTFGKKTFDDLVYIELLLPYGRRANGEQNDASLAIGLRYLFD